MTLLTLQRARYVLAQQGEWIFDGLLREEVLEYVVTLCTLFRLMAAPKQNPARLATMMTLCDRFQYIHTRLLPPPCRPLQFHRLQHDVELVKDFGPMFIYWCFRAERTMGRLQKSCLQEITTTSGHADQQLWKFAYRIIRRRKRLGYRLDFAKFPEGSPLRVSGWQMLLETEHDFCMSVVELKTEILHCLNVIYNLQYHSLNSLFVLLGGSLRKLDANVATVPSFNSTGAVGSLQSLYCKVKAVVPYRLKQAAILARCLATLDNDESTHEPLRWISVKDISSAAVSLLKPLADTAASSQTTRIVMPVFDF
eukprot:g55441.t1